MAVDIFGRSLINDGEGLDPNDLSDLSARTLAIMFDQLIADMFPRAVLGTTLDAQRSADITTMPFAVSLTVTGARPRQGSANNKIQIAPGTLLQAIGAADGTEPKLLAYTFAGTEEVTIANGDATNPRVDIVQMKLEYVNDTPTVRDFQDATTRANTSTTFNIRRRVKCTLSIKQGTPAASPTYPTPDAGNVLIAGVVVGATYAGGSGLLFEDTAGAVVVLHDQRMPLRIRAHGSWPSDFFYPDGGDYVLAGRIYVIRNAVTGAFDISMPLKRWGNTGRLVEMDCAFSETGTLNSKLARWRMDGGFLTILNEANMGGSGGGVMSLRRSGILLFAHAPAAGPTVQAVTVNGVQVGPPVWTNGMRAPALQNTGEYDTTFPISAGNLVLYYINPPAGTRFHRATFYVAEGM